MPAAKDAATKVWEALLDGPRTEAELMVETQLRQPAVQNGLRELTREARVSHFNDNGVRFFRAAS
jgi:hypothetical protein